MSAKNELKTPANDSDFSPPEFEYLEFEFEPLEFEFENIEYET